MITKNSIVNSKNGLPLLGASAALLLVAATSEAGFVAFDNISNYEGGNPAAKIATTGSVPNTFMGQGYVLAPGTIAITGFDLYPANLSGPTYTGLKVNIFVWDTVNMGTVNASHPAFGNLLGSYSFTESGTFTTGTYYPQEGSPVGSAPGFTLPTPLTLADTTIGLSFNVQGTTDGIHYNNANNLSPLISYGTLPSVGSEVFNGYYRNASSEVNGNFTSSLRTLGYADQSLAVRIYGETATVPEPSTFAMSAVLVLPFGMLVVRHLRQRSKAA